MGKFNWKAGETKLIEPQCNECKNRKATTFCYAFREIPTKYLLNVEKCPKFKEGESEYKKYCKFIS